MLIVFFLVLGLWGMGGSRSFQSDPSYLPVLTGIAIISEVLAYISLFNAPLKDIL